MEPTSICVVGAGRLGAAVAARLAERVPTRTTGRELDTGDADLVLVAVPDRAISEVARAVPPGPWIAHTSGARTLDSLDPHTRRFSLHPLQTFVRSRGPEQFDGAWASVSGETPEAVSAGLALADLLRVRAFELDDADRPLYHAAAAVASSFLVAVNWAASGLFEEVGAPPEALLPLMRQTMDNGFELTGPLTRGDYETVERHREALRDRRPDLEPMYTALSDVAAAVAGAATRP